MAIPLVHEDYLDIPDLFGIANITEKCFFCKAPSRFWHHASNQPVCPTCSQAYIVADLPVIPGLRKEKAPKALSQAHIALLAESDRIEAEVKALERKLHLLNCEKRTLHRKMTEAKVIIKNPLK